jgi:hypothetical protein
MKKTLIALAAVAVSGAAFAQVTLTGAVAIAVQSTAANSDSQVNVSDADLKAAVSEDLGGGMKVGATLRVSTEGMRGGASGVSVEETTLSISGGFGTLVYANVLSGSAKMSGGISAEDDISDNIGGYANVNVVDYTLPSFLPGLAVTFETVTVASTSAVAADVPVNGDWSLLLDYKTGPLAVHYEAPSNDLASYDLRVKYDAGFANFGVRATKSKKTEFAVTAPMGAMTVGYHYAKNGGAAHATTNTMGGNSVWGVSANYALSKRTSIGASYVDGTKGASAAAGFDTSNYRVQLKHTF